MSNPPPFAALDAILIRTRHLLLQFDGPVCDPYAHQPAGSAADQLRAILTTQGIEMPASILATTNPLTVLAFTHSISAVLADQAEAELTRHELAAVPSAQPAGYAHDAITSARETGRSVAVIGSWSAQAMYSYLTRANLDELVETVIGRGDFTHIPRTGHELIALAVEAMAASPSACALVAESVPLIDAAKTSGLATIGYSPAPATSPSLAAHADTTVASLADLVLRLRARPLPN